MIKQIPFDINLKDDIERGKYRVVTRDGRNVRIVCYDANDLYPICAYIDDNLIPDVFTREGKWEVVTGDMDEDLFLEYDEPESELTEFELEIYSLLFPTLDPYSDPDREEVRKDAKIILDFAAKELRKDLPRWRKALAGTKFPCTSVILFHDDPDPRLGNVAINDCWYIPITELRKLPKEMKDD